MTISKAIPKVPTVTEDNMGKATPLAMHLCVFTYHDAGSTKPPPHVRTSLQLLEEYLTDGFVTSTEPILIKQPRKLEDSAYSPLAPWCLEVQGAATPEGQLLAGSVGYIKGQARVHTVIG